MSVSLRNSPNPRPPRVRRQAGDKPAIGWMLAAVAVVALLGVSYWAWSERGPANPPAVTAAPAPATGVPAPAPETTTGQAPSPAR
jgi:hypothetical protein